MLGRVKDAVADAAETLRRAFAGVPSHALEVAPFRPGVGTVGGLQAAAAPAWAPPAAEVQAPGLLCDAVHGHALERFQAVLQAESGWARWGVEAEVVRMTPLTAGAAARLEVPPLPRRPGVARLEAGVAAPATRRVAEALPSPRGRRLDPTLERPGSEPGLGRILSLPVPIQGLDVGRLPKGLWMRYSLQLVKGTGENVRNLEVLGCFRIPRKGVADLRHDPRRGRLLLQLEPAAVKADRAPFILARRKDDGAFVSCFVEDP